MTKSGQLVEFAVTKEDESGFAWKATETDARVALRAAPSKQHCCLCIRKRIRDGVAWPI